MNIYKKNGCSLFFLFYFAVYAVSPVIYTISDCKASEIIAGKTEVSSFAEAYQVLLLSKFWEKIILRKAGPSGGARTKFLAMKQRAVLPDNGLEGTPYPEASLGEDVPLFRPAPLTCLTSSRATTAGCKEYRPLFSCHSPPASLPLLS